MFNVLDIFSGIGGFSLGLERTGGFKTVAFCEIEPFCRKVLKKHWPSVPCYEDVRELTADTLRRDGIAVDVICGGFPCQDISVAGKRAGLQGARSGLWSEYRRLIGEIRPRFVIVENVANLLSLGLGDVLMELSEIGYDAEWNCIPASAIGAPHQRDRVWIVANPRNARLSDNERSDAGFYDRAMFSGCRRESSIPNQWDTEPDVGRMANGVPNRVDRLRALGNAVVPQIPELIGRAILQAGAA